jgi:hypothetical protein
MRAIITLPNAQTTAEVEVYRDGPGVVLISKGAISRATPNGGMIRAVGQGMIHCESLEDFEYLRNRAKRALAKKFERTPAVYCRIVKEFELDKDVSGAEELPEHLRAGVRARLLPTGSGG